MSKYRFDTTITVYGYIEAEIGDQDPDKYIKERIELGITARDLTFIRDDEVECDGWTKL